MRKYLRILAVAVVCALALTAGPAMAQAAPRVAGKDFTKPATVILGYGLKPDGSMRAILYHRTLTGLAIAQAFPQAPVIVTGGNPQNGQTEAAQMRNLLLMLGLPANRIIVEDRADSTVQNAQFSVPLAKKAGATGIIVVTSSTHQGRADQNFADAGGNVLATVSFPDGNPSVNIVQFVRDVLSPLTPIG
ncbi:YdcF family protein [Mycobacterium sp. DBP42]|uniref:YdcF family protein n=1 Tax=Mycobacterium sp. DBP42 TaxID=2545267 RepID=UPI00110CB70B|nr:YdcF family protein [Mycobacterium sp. DBP42]TMS53646.1 YdcF family protein [Mycobacterium sp. DBP42]